MSGGLLLFGAAPAHATETPFVAWDTTSSGEQTASTVSTVAADTVTLVRDGRDTATAGTSAETSNLGADVAAGEVITVDYALTDGADFASGAVRLFIYYTPDADTWNVAPDQVATADASSGTLSITATGGTIGTAGVVYDTSNPSNGAATFSRLTVAGKPVSFLPGTDEEDPDPGNDEDPAKDDDPGKDEDAGKNPGEDTGDDSTPAPVPTAVPAGAGSVSGGPNGAVFGLAAIAVIAAAGGIALLRRRPTTR